jgi:hypothetical protein
MDSHKLKINSNVMENELVDVYDGRLYKELLASEDGESFKRKEAFCFLLNTDGISICDKSKITIWPIYLVINEIPIEERFCIKNVILAGLSVGEEKPNIISLLSPIVRQLKQLEYGIKISIDGEINNRRFFLLYGIFDKPAKASILNMISSHGYYGCTKCEIKGEDDGSRILILILNI